MCSTALSAWVSEVFISEATSVRPSSRAGGDLQRCAVTMFCRFVDWRVLRTASMASQMRLIFEPDGDGMVAAGAGLDVSLYSVCVTSSSLKEERKRSI